MPTPSKVPAVWQCPLLLATLLLCAACGGSTSETLCTLEARAGITVDVRDSVTNAAAGGAARVIARAGAFADTARSAGGSDGLYPLVYERPGTYTVTVEEAGYQLWTRTGVTVTKGKCHVNAVSLTARLQK